MSDDPVSVLRRALADATPGPWETSDDGSLNTVEHDGWEICNTSAANARFIAAARNHLPAVLDRLDAAETEAARYRTALEDAPGWRHAEDCWQTAHATSPTDHHCDCGLTAARAALRPAAHQDSEA